MENTFSTNEAIGIELTKALQLEYKAALVLLSSSTNENLHNVVHEVRKCFKKIRALLRLIRYVFPEYKSYNRSFRDFGRTFAQIRDASAMIEAIDLLYLEQNNKLSKETFDAFRESLITFRKQLEDTYFKHRGIVKTLDSYALECSTKLNVLQIQNLSFQSVLLGVKKVYSRGREAYKLCKHIKSTENFHNWRKRVKYLGYQFRFLNPIWPGFLTLWENELHKLSDLLGHDRDLYLITIFMIESNHALDFEHVSELTNLIKDLRKKMQDESLILGKRLYHLKSNDFVSLINSSQNNF